MLCPRCLFSSDVEVQVDHCDRERRACQQRRRRNLLATAGGDLSGMRLNFWGVVLGVRRGVGGVTCGGSGIVIVRYKSITRYLFNPPQEITTLTQDSLR